MLLIVSFTGNIYWVNAQVTDYATYLRAGMQYEMNKSLEFSGGLEWRTKDDLKMTDRL